MTDIIENKITELNNISDYQEKLEQIKNIKNDINKENIQIDYLLASLDNDIIIKKTYNITKIIDNFDTYDINKKIKYYQYLNQYIKKVENNLFEIT